MKRGGFFVCAGLALLIAALVGAYGQSYAALAGALEREGCSEVICHELIRGGHLSDAALAAARARLGGITLTRDKSGDVYGYFSSGDALDCAFKELLLRGALGAWASGNRWASGISATRVKASAALDAYANAAIIGSADAARIGGINSSCANAARAGALAALGAGDDGSALSAKDTRRARLLALALDLLNGAGDRAVTRYIGADSASARGKKYHAAAHMGINIECFLAEGYLPIDY